MVPIFEKTKQIESRLTIAYIPLSKSNKQQHRWLVSKIFRSNLSSIWFVQWMLSLLLLVVVDDKDDWVDSSSLQPSLSECGCCCCCDCCWWCSRRWQWSGGWAEKIVFKQWPLSVGKVNKQYSLLSPMLQAEILKQVYNLSFNYFPTKLNMQPRLLSLKIPVEILYVFKKCPHEHFQLHNNM